MRHAAKLRRNQRRQHLFLFALLCLVLIAGYLVLHLVYQPYTVHSKIGWAYGISACVLFFLVAAYSLRRRFMNLTTRLKLGSTRVWLNFHLYGGMLFLLLMFMHTGFHLPHGQLSWCLWSISLLTVFTGLLGRALQRWIPKVLASGLSVEVLFERIPDLVDQLRLKSEALCAMSEPSVQALYQQYLAPAMASPRLDMIYFVDITGGIQSRLGRLHYLHEFLKPEDVHRLKELEANYKAKLEIDAHYTLQQALRLWLFLHVPPALVLLLLICIHVFCVLYY